MLNFGWQTKTKGPKICTFGRPWKYFVWYTYVNFVRLEINYRGYFYRNFERTPKPSALSEFFRTSEIATPIRILGADVLRLSDKWLLDTTYLSMTNPDYYTILYQIGTISPFSIFEQILVNRPSLKKLHYCMHSCHAFVSKLLPSDLV